MGVDKLTDKSIIAGTERNGTERNGTERNGSRILHGDSVEMLKTIPDGTVDCCVTSPPYYGLRDYGKEGQIGLEESPGEYIEKLVRVFREVKRVLRDDGTLWLNIGDSYSGSGKGPSGKISRDCQNMYKIGKGGNIPKGTKPKDLIGIPWMLAFALRDDGWYLRQDIIWHKPNPMPESVRDRCTKSHEYIFLFSKKPKYYFDSDAIRENAKPDNSVRDRDHTKLNNTPGRTRMGGLKTNHYTKRNKRDVWKVATRPYKEAHFATFPEQLIEPCILAGSRPDGIVLDPFFGSGTTGVVAEKYGRRYIGVELNEEYIELAKKRLNGVQMTLPIVGV